MASSLAAVHAAVLATLTTLYAADPQVTVLDGGRGPFTREDVVSLADITTDVDVAAMATTRPKYEMHEVTVVISCSRAGTNDTAQAVATTRVCALWSTLFEALRSDPTLGITGPTTTLALAHAARTELRKADDPDILAKGRNSTITATITVRMRI